MSLSRADIVAELAELEGDLQAFSEAYRLLERRCFDAEDARFHPILTWQGADAALFVLGTCTQKIQGVISEYRMILAGIDEGSIPDTDKPKLRVLHGDD